MRGIAVDALHVYVSAWTFEDGDDETTTRLEVWTHDGELEQTLPLEPHLSAGESQIVDMGIGMAIATGIGATG